MKRPPVFHYYWSPKVSAWPREIADFGGSFSGPYFAYLMIKHGLGNVYLTNLVKCSWRTEPDSANDEAVIRNCVSRWLQREVDLLRPRIVFCFGRKVEKRYRSLVSSSHSASVAYLIHHSYIAHKWQLSGRSQQQLIDENDATIRATIAGI